LRLLVDTHVWLWLQTTPDRVDAATLRVLADEANDLYLSAASGWEIAIKYGLGKLALPQLPEVYVPDRMRTSGTTPLAIEHAHALRVAKLPDHHRDPFDRLLIAQAQLLGLPIVTADPQFSMYDVELMAA
jgi:PIN domain nuclease of toxin-antitoxin system